MTYSVRIRVKTKVRGSPDESGFRDKKSLPLGVDAIMLLIAG